MLFITNDAVVSSYMDCSASDIAVAEDLSIYEKLMILTNVLGSDYAEFGPVDMFNPNIDCDWAIYGNVMGPSIFVNGCNEVYTKHRRIEIGKVSKITGNPITTLLHCSESKKYVVIKPLDAILAEIPFSMIRNHRCHELKLIG